MLAALTSFAAVERVALLSRHGERERLIKHHTTLDEAGADSSRYGGPALLASGLGQLSRVGQALREVYLSPTCAPEACLAGTGVLERADVHAESSGLVRTLDTAAVLLGRLSPPRGGGPPQTVFSRAEAEDYVLRGYAADKCAALTRSLREWYSSAAFREQEEASAALRREAAAALRQAETQAAALEEEEGRGDGDEGGSGEAEIPLRDWWNAWDALSTSPQPLLPPEAMRRAEALIAWLEAHKFTAAPRSHLCGGALLSALLDHLTAPLDAPRLLYFSAHYPSLLCLLGALGLSTDSGLPADRWLSERLIAPASVLAFELHSAAEAAPPSYHLQLWLLNSTQLAAEGSNASAVAAARRRGGGGGGWVRLELPCGAAGEARRCDEAAVALRGAPPAAAPPPPLRVPSASAAASAFCEACGSTAENMAACARRGGGEGQCVGSGVVGLASGVAAAALLLLAAGGLRWSRQGGGRRARPVTNTLAAHSALEPKSSEMAVSAAAAPVAHA
ncbi:hypothetical protein AB1Y20_020813 [Prymnesium parvum]|uniref:Acid phosphatase n=1 Tax=Prymnesium parvum TaxID=97485 RepID=A0AB34JYA6_PRYPA